MPPERITRDLQRRVTCCWRDLQAARVNGSAARITGIEYLMNQALDELAARQPQHDAEPALTGR